jgi:ATP/maltotriose-dependent transcriptional regulator MalT
LRAVQEVIRIADYEHVKHRAWDLWCLAQINSYAGARTARLFISERTIVSHVRNIMNKPGFSSRARIAGWMTAPDP